MKNFRIVVYNAVSRAKYTYEGSFHTIEEAISYYTHAYGNSRVIEAKELRVRL